MHHDLNWLKGLRSSMNIVDHRWYVTWGDRDSWKKQRGIEYITAALAIDTYTSESDWIVQSIRDTRVITTTPIAIHSGRIWRYCEWKQFTVNTALLGVMHFSRKSSGSPSTAYWIWWLMKTKRNQILIGRTVQNVQNIFQGTSMQSLTSQLLGSLITMLMLQRPIWMVRRPGVSRMKKRSEPLMNVMVVFIMLFEG